MSREELVQRYQTALTKREIKTDEGLQAAAIIAAQAAQEGVTCALAGGVAMHIYGYARATEDVDVLASGLIALPAKQQLTFGGASHLVQVGAQTVTVDVIVRSDFFRSFYEAALRDAQPLPNGLRIVTPEWLVILKFLAKRSKDVLDLLWLLREPGLVDRTRIRQLLESVLGQTGAQVALAGLETYYVQAAVMAAGDENGQPT